MKAAVARSFHESIAIEEVPIPEQVLVRIEATA